MSGLLRAGSIIAFLISAAPAQAHVPIEGVGGFYGGLLHPILVPAHALALLALGIFIGQRQHGRGTAVLIFAAALVAGLIAIALAVGELPAEEVLLGTTALVALLVAMAWTPPGPLAWLLAAVAGAALALDSPPQTTSIEEGTIMLIGTGLGACIAVATVVEGAQYVTHEWQRIAVRVLGSWIAASAILVLAMRWR